MGTKIISAIMILSFLLLTGCAGGGGGYSRAYYGHRYGPDPWYYRGGYVRDRVHVVSEEEIRDIEEVEAATMPSTPVDSAPDMGMGDMDMGGMDMDMDFGGFD